MAMNELSRAVALKALAADVSARLRLGEKPDAIRAELLAEGYPPEVIDHVFAECEATRPTGRKRTIFAAILSAVLMLGLPLVGGIGGAWGTGALFTHESPPELIDRAPDQVPELDEHLKAEARGTGGPGALLMVFVGGALGFGLGLAVAFLAVGALSTWSLDSSITDDEAYD
jgi:hypothetical protein